MPKKKLKSLRKSKRQTVLRKRNRLDDIFDKETGLLSQFGEVQRRNIHVDQIVDDAQAERSGEADRKRIAIEQFKRTGKLPGRK